MSIHFIFIPFEEKEKRNSRFLFFFFFFFFSLCLSRARARARVSVSSAHSLYCVVIERARADRECLLFKYFVVVTFFFSSDGAFAHSTIYQTRDFGKKTEALFCSLLHKKGPYLTFVFFFASIVLLRLLLLLCVCVCVCARVRN